MPQTSWRGSGGLFTNRTDPRFTPSLTWHFGQNGDLWLGETSAYLIHRRTLDGDTTLIFSLDTRPAAVSQSGVDSVLAARQGRFALVPEDVPATKPILQRIFSDDQRYVYVLFESESVASGSAIDVFSLNGRFVGRLASPVRVAYPLPAPIATPGHLYVAMIDSMGVEYVSRIRIQRTSGR